MRRHDATTVHHRLLKTLCWVVIPHPRLKNKTLRGPRAIKKIGGLRWVGWCSRTWSGLLLAAAACCLLGEHAHVPIPEGMALGRGIDPSDKPHGPASAEPRAPAARPTGYTKVFHAHCAPNLPATTPRRRLLSVAPLVLAESVLYISGCGLALYRRFACLGFGNWRARLRRTSTPLGSAAGAPNKANSKKIEKYIFLLKKSAGRAPSPSAHAPTCPSQREWH